MSVESVLSQTLNDFEFIIVDDGSISDVEEMVKGVCDRRISYYRHCNIGLTKSLNKLTKRCKGQYIARMDADDLCAPDRLEKQVKVLENYPKVELCASAYHVIDDCGTVTNTSKIIANPVYRHWRLHFHNTYAHGSVMLRSEVFKDRGLIYDENIDHGQDYDLWLRLCNPENTYVIDEPLYSHRVCENPDQISYRHNISQKRSAEAVSKLALKRLNPFLTDEDCSILRGFYISSSLNCQISTELFQLIKAVVDSFVDYYELSARSRYTLRKQVYRDVINRVIPRTVEGERAALYTLIEMFSCSPRLTTASIALKMKDKCRRILFGINTSN